MKLIKYLKDFFKLFFPNIKFKIILLLIFVLILNIVFFKLYKERKISHYNALIKDHKEQVYKIDKLFSFYYHQANKFNFDIVEKNKPIKTNLKNYSITKFKTNLWFAKSHAYKDADSTAYIDIYEENVVLTSGTGLVLFFNIKEFSNNKINPKKIRTNIKEIIKDERFFFSSDFGVKDILIQEDNLFVSYNNEVSKGCFNTGILKAKMNYNFLKFEKFFNAEECRSKLNSKYKTFSVGQAGGRMQTYNKKILLTHGSYSEFDLSQNSQSIFGKILLIDNDGRNYKIISKGHRNQQGLFYNKEKDLIIETEHGPEGGDEINIIQEGNNYGWPIASYGKHYQGKKHMDKVFPLPNSHNGFTEPAKFFKSSVAISQIIYLPIEFSNNIKDTYMLATMKINKDFGNEINLFELEVNKNKISINDIIPIGERIRDVIFIEKINAVLMFLDTTASIAILSKKK